MASDEASYDRLLTPPDITVTSAAFIEEVWVLGDEPSLREKRAPDSSTANPKSRVIEGHFDRQINHDETVHIAACSEIMLHHEALSLFAIDSSVNGHRSSSFRLLNDIQGQQIVVTVSNTARLYYVCHVNGAQNGWQAIDVTPAAALEVSKRVSTFDVLQLGLSIHIVASAGDILYHASFTLDALSADAAPNRVQGLALNSTCWTAIANYLGFQVLVGSVEQTTAGIASTYYQVDPSPKSIDSAWHACYLPEAAQNVLALEPAATSYSEIQEGVFALYTQKGGNQRLALSGLSPNGKQTQDFMVDMSHLGTFHDIYASTNPWKANDLFIAGQGIGFVEADSPEQPPQILLPNIEFEQVVAAERPVATNETRISVLGVSTSNELYFLEGRRVLNAACQPTIDFPVASGFPIRKGVSQISPMFNKLAASTEILYASNVGDNCLYHWIRDPQTSMWSETSLRTTVIERATDPSQSSKKMLGGGTQYYAYVTNVTLDNGGGAPIPANYTVQLSCEAPMLLTVNGRSYNIGVKPQEIQTRANGQIEIIMRVHGLLGCPRYTVSMTESCSEAEKAKVYHIQPAQRVLRKLGQIESTSDLKNAKQTDGKEVFASNSASDQDFDSMARMLKQFPDMMKSISGGVEKEDGGIQEHADFIIDEHGSLTNYHPKDPDKEEPSGFENALSVVGEAIGDVIELVEKGFKTILRVSVRVMGPVIKLYLKLQDAVISFVIKTAVTLLRTVTHFLKDTFGLDMSKLCGFLGFLFDIDSIKSIQNELKATASSVTNIARVWLPEVCKVVNKNLDNAQAKIEDFLGRDSNQPKTKPPKLPKWLRLIFDNPIIHAVFKFKPLAWITDVLGEEAENLGIKIPVSDLGAMFSKFESILVSWATRTAEKIMGLLSDLTTKIATLLADPQKALEALRGVLQSLLAFIFDSLKEVVNLVSDTLIAFIDGIGGFMNDTWKVPIVSALWESFADQELSITNFVTFLVAHVMNIMAAPVGGADKIIKALKVLQGKLKRASSNKVAELDLFKPSNSSPNTNKTPATATNSPAADTQLFAQTFSRTFSTSTANIAGTHQLPDLKPEDVFADLGTSTTGSDPESEKEEAKKDNLLFYQIFALIATLSRTAHTALTAWLGDFPGDQPGRGGPNHNRPTSNVGILADGSQVAIELQPWNPAGNKENLLQKPKKAASGSILGLRDTLMTLLAGMTTVSECLALYFYLAIPDLPLSERVATFSSAAITMAGWFFVAVSARSGMSVSRMNRIAGYIFRTEQIVAGFVRWIGYPIDLLDNRPAVAGWRMPIAGSLNVFQGAFGCLALLDPELESRLLFCIFDGGLVLIIGALNLWP